MLKMILTAVDLLNGASVWLVLSFMLAGLMHHFISPERLQHMLGNRNFSSIIKATLSGMVLPICSCGVIPLGLGLFYSGAYLGPTLAFMTATPILNPAALLLTYGFLGPQIASIYFITGLFASLIIGVIGNALAGSELYAPGMQEPVELVKLEAEGEISLLEKIQAGLVWGFQDMGAAVSKYVCFGLLLVGIILTVMPPSFIQQYLGQPGFISLVGIAALGAVMYVCAVGHIPFIAVLVASGAAPGLAITFLMTGAATNIPELLSIYNMIGKRAVVIYFSVMTGISFMAGYLTNLLLMPDFVPFFNLDQTQGTVNIANKLILVAPEPLQYICSVMIITLAGYAVWPNIRRCLPGEAGI